MTDTQRIGIQRGTRFIRLDRCINSWRVWIACNADYTQGTYLSLHDDGAIKRVTLEPDGTEYIALVKPSPN